MPLNQGGVIVYPLGSTCVVDILQYPTGGSITVFSDPACTSTISLPATITEPTTFYVSSQRVARISLKVSDIELATRGGDMLVYSFAGGQLSGVAPADLDTLRELIEGVGGAHNHDAAYAPLVVPGRAKAGATTYPNVPGVSWTGNAADAIAAGVTYYFPMVVHDPCTLDELWIEVTSAGGAGTRARLAVYNADVDMQPTTLLVGPSTELAVDSTGIKKLTGLATAAPAGRYLLALRSDGTPTLRKYRGVLADLGLHPDLAATGPIITLNVTEAYGVWAADGTNWDTASGDGGAFFWRVFCVLSAT